MTFQMIMFDSIAFSETINLLSWENVQRCMVVFNEYALVLIAIIAGWTLIITRKKQKQDLWKLRWEFYEELREIYCHNGFYWKMKDYYIKVKEHGPQRDNNFVKDLRRRFPGFMGGGSPDGIRLPIYHINMEKFDVIYEKANFLFDEEIEKLLEYLSPQNRSGNIQDETFPNFDEVWTQKGFARKFDKYLKLR